MTDRISRDETLMRTAELWASRSTCLKPNGALLSREGKVISIGYNGAPAGHSHCTEVGCLNDDKGGCIRTIHAEINSVAMAARYGISTGGATMYCTTSPCYTCAKLLISAGISKVVYRILYRDPLGIDLLKKSKIEVMALE